MGGWGDGVQHFPENEGDGGWGDGVRADLAADTLPPPRIFQIKLQVPSGLRSLPFPGILKELLNPSRDCYTCCDSTQVCAFLRLSAR